MQTQILSMGSDPKLAEADAILRSCVHCGFCNATCPTYRLLGSELDGPRGRIYLIKSLLEGNVSGDKTRLHLDRCLTCRSCETTCPSGVKYSRLLDIGRSFLNRSFSDRMKRKVLLAVLPNETRLRRVFTAVRTFKPLFPQNLKSAVPAVRAASPRLQHFHPRRMLVLEGCVQKLVTPATNAAAARVLDKLGISLIGADGCCGAMHAHLGSEQDARNVMRRNIDAWWPHVKSGMEAIVSTASGCGLMVKEYGKVLEGDIEYRTKAARISALARDISEILQAEDIGMFSACGGGKKVACHASCTLLHGQKLDGVVESLLERCGYRLVPVADGHICCGAAGTYSLLQRKISGQLLENKLRALETSEPDVIVTSNIGCQMHLESGTRRPVRHWIELLDQPQKGIS